MIPSMKRHGNAANHAVKASATMHVKTTRQELNRSSSIKEKLKQPILMQTK
jgi:hypothetical protein